MTIIAITIPILCRVDASVFERITILWRRAHVGSLAFRAPNQRLESSFCVGIAWRRLPEKECVSQTPVSATVLEYMSFYVFIRYT